MPVAASAARGPRRSIQRPSSGEVTALATSCTPTRLPAKAIDPVRSRTCSSVASPTVPSGSRVNSDSTMKRGAPGARQYAA